MTIFFAFLTNFYYLCNRVRQIVLTDSLIDTERPINNRTMKHSIYTILLAIACTAICSVSGAQEYTLRHYDDHNGLSHHRVSRVIQDSTGMIWIGTYNGLNRFDGYRFTVFKPEEADELTLPSDRIRRIDLTDNNNILCLIDDTVVLFNTRTCHFEPLSADVPAETISRMQMQHNPDLWRPRDRVYAVGNLSLTGIRSDYEDRQGNHWLVDEHGLYVATPLPTRGIRINRDEIRAMKRMHDGKILTSIQGTKQLAVYDQTMQLLGYVKPDGRLSKQPTPFTSQIYCFYESRDSSRIYLGCKPGCLIEYRPDNSNRTRKPGQFITHPELRNVYDVLEDKSGTIWAATFGFGLWRKIAQNDPAQGAKDESAFELVPGTEQMRIRRLLVLDDNTLLAATEDGLLIIDGMSATAPLNDGMMRLIQREGGREHSLSSNAILGLALFDGQLYVATEGGGVNRLISPDIHVEQPEFEHITQADGLSSDIVYEFLPWSANELLVQCNNALCVLNTATGKIVNYGKSFFQSAGELSSNLGEVQPIDLGDGRILVAPHDGLQVLSRQDLTPETEPVNIAFNAFALEGKVNYAVDHISHLTLSSKERSLGMSFAALDYRGNTDIHYRTRFYAKGETVPWGAPTDMSQVLIQDMPPGEYVFEVCSTNALGQWQENTRQLFITVKPTFWQSTTGWTLQIGMLLLIAIAITIQSTRVHYHRKQRAETLDAYLDLQERYLLISDQHAAVNSQHAVTGNQPLPIPEILAPGYTSDNEKFLNTLHVFMEQHISDNNMSIDDIAKVTCMSRSSLNRKMHDLFNLSAKDFVQAARIKHACNLLRTTDMSAKEVAYACGFSDPRYFSKSFKTNTGKTPTEYRGLEVES